MRSWVCFLGVLLSSAAASAQTIPPSAEPGRVEKRFDSPPRPASRPDVLVPGPDRELAPERAAKVKIQVGAINLEGSSVYTGTDLEELYAPYIGQEVSLADIYKLRDDLTAKYRADGYVLSQVIVPAQRIKDGQVTLQAVEGYISEILFEGAFAEATDRLSAITAPITQARPLRIEVLERAVLLIDDIPGVTARTVLRPGTEPGAATLIVITERKEFDASLSVDNRGTEAIGPYQINASLAMNGTLSDKGRTALRFIAIPDVKELLFGDVSHEEPIGDQGAKVSVGVRYNRSEPGGSIEAFEIDSRSLTFSAQASLPLIRSRSETFRIDLGLNVVDTESLSFGATLSEDSIRKVNGGFFWDIADSWGGSNILQGSVVKGLTVLGSSERGDDGLTRSNGRPDFFRVTWYLQRVQPLIEGFTLVLSHEGQWAPHGLLSSEEYGIGGSAVGRGFDSSEITGDKGGAFIGELQYELPTFELADYAQLYVSADWGKVWSYEDGTASTRLASAAAGLRFGLFEHVTLDLQVAKPLLRAPSETGDQGARFFFALGVSY